MKDILITLLFRAVVLSIPGDVLVGLSAAQGVLTFGNWCVYYFLTVPFWIVFSVPIAEYLKRELIGEVF